MKTKKIVIVCIIWWIIGVCSSVKYHIKKDSLRVNDIPVVVFEGCIGPSLIIMNWFIASDFGKTIIISERK